ncbi:MULTISPECIES: hypothetical protein [unclassified Streptomyces]|uniref:hypothetical protein n=1 Tax=unclassified Streptomyces TaxID=2593676 RepID=UPI0008DC5C1F|nr:MULTISPECIES: hypothetical protein [unclassified Streptomyces]OII65380.1 hypothetical protein BJP39_29015 [Streptomyces sp. CC77]
MAGDDELRDALRGAARAHRPDRARMLARVERGMADRAAPPAPGASRWSRTPWLRVATATAAVAAVLGAGAYTAASVLRGAPVPSAATPPAVEAPATPRPPSPSAKPAGYLSGEGVIDPHSNRYWAQSNVTVRTAVPLAAFAVELRVAQTGGVADTGNWRSLPEGDFTVAVREEAGALVYTWTLRPGRTVPAGQHVFAGQYNHAEGVRDAGGDRFTARATAQDGTEAALSGGF